MEKVIKKCKMCGREFTAHRATAKWCGVECKQKSQLKHKREYARKKRGYTKHTRNCTECGKEFTTVKARVLTCSPECRRERQSRIVAIGYEHRKKTKETRKEVFDKDMKINPKFLTRGKIRYSGYGGL